MYAFWMAVMGGVVLGFTSGIVTGRIFCKWHHRDSIEPNCCQDDMEMVGRSSGCCSEDKTE